MLKGSNDNSLKSKHINEHCVSFYQKWQELVDRRTLDVYQYRILTSLSALKELIIVIDKTLKGLFNSDANVNACREETLHIINNDVIMNIYYKCALNRLQSSLSNSTKSNPDKNKLLFQLQYIVKEIEPNYLALALTELKLNIDENNIEKIEKQSTTVASQAIYNGWSSKALLDLLRFFHKDECFENQWNLFTDALLNFKDIDHYVFINIPFRNQDTSDQQSAIDTLQQLDSNIKSCDQIITEFDQITDLKLSINREKRYFYVSVKSKDVYSAAHKAISEIAEKLNFASFYNLVNAWDLKTTVIVSINSQSKYRQSFPAKKLYETHDYIDTSSRVFEKTRRIFVDENRHHIRDKLQGAFGYTNTSRASLFQEEKYMALWVALESLARTDMHSNIISSVKETVPAAMSLRYIYRVVRNFIEDCTRCSVSFDFSSCCINAQQSTKQLMVQEFIKIIKTDSHYEELKNKCEVNSLLRHRLVEIHSLVTSIKYAKTKIENHYKSVNWQIQRLYRIRNEIAHAALREQTSLIVYIEHLYDYLSTYISEIVTFVVDKDLNSIEEALSCIKDNYDAFIALSNSSDQALIEEKVLKTGIINLI